MVNDAEGKQINKGHFVLDLQNGNFGIVSAIKVATVPSGVEGQLAKFMAVYVVPIEEGESQGTYFNHPKAFIHVTPELISQQIKSLHDKLKLLDKVSMLAGMPSESKVVRVLFSRVSKVSPKKPK